MHATPLSAPDVPLNNTVKLPAALRFRVSNAMLAEGHSIWAEFCRVSLTEKCQRTEQKLRIADPLAYQSIYGLHRSGAGTESR